MARIAHSSRGSANERGRGSAKPQRLFLQPGVHLAVLSLACALAYGPGLSRGLVSEDFLFLGHLARRPFWATAFDHFTGPLLGVSFVSFYRPVSITLLHLEFLAWGTTATGFLVSHLIVHLVNVALVYCLVRRWTHSKAAGFGTALTFGLYPLHPNTVLFIASYATLFSSTCILTSLLLHERRRDASSDAAGIGPLLFFSLALLSYEQAAMLPALVGVRELLASPHADGVATWRRALKRVSPFLVVLAAYLVIRRLALGQWIGGYGGFQIRWLRHGLAGGGGELLDALTRLVWPVYTGPWSASIAASAIVLLAIGSLWSAFRDHGRAAGRVWGIGLVWVVASIAPFGFDPVVPATGRYWYLTSIGLGLIVSAGAWMLADAIGQARVRAHRATVLVCIAGGLGLAYWPLAVHYAHESVEAGQVARRVRHAITLLPDAENGPVFVTGYPAFIENRRGVPVAQVFHWGLADALEPPFVTRAVTVYPLLDFADEELVPLLERPDVGRVWRWHPELDRFVSVQHVRPSLDRIDVRPGSTPDTLRYQPNGAARHALVVVARGNASRHPVPDADEGREWVEIQLPLAVVASMRHLYDGAVYAWIEARTRDNGQLRVSPLTELSVTGAHPASGGSTTSGLAW